MFFITAFQYILCSSYAFSHPMMCSFVFVVRFLITFFRFVTAVFVMPLLLDYSETRIHSLNVGDTFFTPY